MNEEALAHWGLSRGNKNNGARFFSHTVLVHLPGKGSGYLIALFIISEFGRKK
jgi:hypothetical protein